MTRVVIVGCGVVGATIAYELSQHPDLTIIVLDAEQSPGQGATGAALGIAMGVISHKTKGRNWRLRETSLRRYPSLLSELASITGHPVPYNQQGILSLCFDADELPRWRSLQEIRQRQGWRLECWTPSQVTAACPHLKTEAIVAGIYSPQDIQIAPKALTQALVAAAQQRHVRFHFGTPASGFQYQAGRVKAVCSRTDSYPADWVILTAGLGSSDLVGSLGQSLPMGPVLGQGIRVRSPRGLGEPDFQPVVNGDDVHLVPLGDREYGVAATVEFPDSGVVNSPPREQALADLWQAAIAYCPTLAESDIVETWYGLRPRPSGQAAPVIKHLDGYANVIIATGHYRNGVLLAPATAEAVKTLMLPADPNP